VAQGMKGEKQQGNAKRLLGDFYFVIGLIGLRMGWNSVGESLQTVDCALPAY
jgi:hypothetical protein